MILYAKSSLELIVNNRIGKVGIRPGRPSSHPRKPRSAQCAAPPPQPSAAHLIWHWSQRVADLLLSVRLSVCLYDRSYRRTVRRYVPTRTWPSHHFRPGYERIYTTRRPAYLHRYVRIITYKRVILSYTPALLMIIKTPRSILFALEYFLKFSPDNGAIRAPRPSSSLHPPFALPPLPELGENAESSGYTRCPRGKKKAGKSLRFPCVHGSDEDKVAWTILAIRGSFCG